MDATQGFITIGEVNSKGKVSRLPIRADIRRALSFPGGSMLMVAHVKKDTSIDNSLQHLNLYFSSAPQTYKLARTMKALS